MVDVPLNCPMVIVMSVRGSEPRQFPVEPRFDASLIAMVNEQTRSLTLPLDAQCETISNDDASCNEGMGVFSCGRDVLLPNDWPPALSVATVIWSRAQERHASNDYEEACALYHQAIDCAVSFTQRNNSGLGLPPPIYDAVFAILIPSLVNLGLVAYSNGQWDSAVSYLQLAMTHEMLTHGNDTSTLGQILNCLSVAVWQRSLTTQSTTDLQSALFFAYEAYRIYSALGNAACPGPSLILATIGYNLGRIHSSRAEYGVALMYLDIALQIRSQTLGSLHWDSAVTKFHVARAYEHVNPTRALAFYEELVPHQGLQQSTHCRDYVVVLERIAKIRKACGDDTGALAMWGQCLAAGRRLLKAHHASELTTLLVRVAKVYQERHDNTQALALYQEGLNILQMASDTSDHPMLVAVLLSMGEMYLYNKDYDTALNLSIQDLEQQKTSHGEWSAQAAHTHCEQ